MGAESGGGELF